MAKVVAPLQSFSASGKIGKSLVFFTHLGRNVVRSLVTPANPKTGSQGDIRQILGGLGRSAKIIVTPSDWFNDLNTITPAGQTWISRYIQSAREAHMSDTAAYEATVTEFEAHTATADWVTEALAAGLTTLDIDYSTTTNDFADGLMLYMIAKYSFDVAGANPSLLDRAPYTTALASWTLSEIQAFIADLQAVA